MITNNNKNLVLQNIEIMMQRYGLWIYVQQIDLVKPDRIYAKVHPSLYGRMHKEVQDQNFKESYPVSKVHHALGEYYFGDSRHLYSYISWRSNSNPSLQITMIGHEVGSPVVDIDIDLANPFRDLWSAMVHFLEVLVSGKTDHVKINKKLRKKGSEWERYL